MTVTARANRSQRPGSTGTPASWRAAPNSAVTAATSAAWLTLIGFDERSQTGRADGLLVLGVLQHRAHGPFRGRRGQLGLAEHADRGGPLAPFPDPRPLAQAQPPQPPPP